MDDGQRSIAALARGNDGVRRIFEASYEQSIASDQSKTAELRIDHGNISIVQTELEDVKLLHDGRHFRLPSGAKVVVGRNQSDNAALLRDCLQGDYVFRVRDGKGPTVVLRSEALEDIKIAASLCARYAKRFESVDVVYGRKSDGACNSILAEPTSGSLYTRYLI